MASKLEQPQPCEVESRLKLHKKPSQPTPIANTSADETRSIISSISNSIRCAGHISMDDSTSEAARNYYQRIVNDARTDYDQKKLQIYLDLVVGSKAALKTNRNNLHHLNEFTLNYKIGTQTESISSAEGCVLTVGRYKENSICTGYKDLTISRIQCFILIIDASLIILDGWSYFGTKTVSVNGNKKEVKDSSPSNRFVLRYNRNDTIHLRFGETNIDLVINPKPCIVCMDKSRTIRNDCGHLVLCKECYNNLVSAKCNSLCPLCRAPLNVIEKIKHLDGYEEDDMIKSYRKPTSVV